MRPADIDWGYLRGPLIAFAVAAAISVALITTSQMFGLEAAKAQKAAQRGLASVRNRYHEMDEEQAKIETYLPLYESLSAQGVIGGERRLDWVESLREAARGAGVIGLRYDLAPRREYDGDMPFAALAKGAHRIYASEMRLELDLFHEGDLARFWRELDERAQGLYSVTGCALNRAAGTLSTDPSRKNLSASCKLDWYTVVLPDAKEAS